MDGGKESDPPIGGPDFEPPFEIKGTINLSPLNVTNVDRKTLNVNWRGWGRPNSLAEPAMQWVGFRTSLNIWHRPDVTIKCANNVPRVSSATFAGASRFPSHRLWVDGIINDFRTQGTFANLWDAHASWRWFVR